MKSGVVVITSAGGPEVLDWTEREVGEPTGEDVLIRVEAAGVNRHDCNQRSRGPNPQQSDIPGLEVAGVVEAVGPGARDIAVGDRVCALVDGGGYAERVVAHRALTFPVPDAFSMAEAASIPEAAFTSWFNFFVVAGMRPGEAALVIGGTSGVGVFALQLLAALGHPVYATCGSAAKCRFAESLGALAAVNYREEPFDARVAQRLGRWIDVALDMSGGVQTASTLEALAPGGRIVHLSPGRNAELRLPLATILRKQARITGSLLRPLPLAGKTSLARELRSTVWPLLGTAIRTQVATTFPIRAVREAHAFMERGDHMGKVVLTL